LIPPEQRFLITIPEQAPIVRDLARGRAMGIIIEPQARNNALPMALSTRMIYERDHDAVIAFLPADHNIQYPERLRAALEQATKVAALGYIVTLGIPTAYPEPNYGHIHRGEPVPGFESGSYPAFEVVRFHEKPPHDVAEQYTEADEWFWNGGYFVFRASTMLELIAKAQPELDRIVNENATFLSMAKPALTNPVIDWSSSGAISGIYKNLPPQLRTSIDYALIEKAGKIATIPVEMGWNDLGGFNALSELFEPDESCNRTAPRVDGEDPRVLLPGCSDVSVFPSKRTIVCLDLEDIIVVDTPDALLVLPRSSSRRVSGIVELLNQRGWNNLL
jgi:mannose-1-phosphate guanylyltransferase